MPRAGRAPRARTRAGGSRTGLRRAAPAARRVPAGRQAGLAGREQPPGPVAGVARSAAPPARTPMAATACAPRPPARAPAVVQLLGRRLVRPERGLRQVPGPPVDVARRAARRPPARCSRAPFARAGGRVDRRAGQRVGELDPVRTGSSPAPARSAAASPPTSRPSAAAGAADRGQVPVSDGGHQQHVRRVSGLEPGGPGGRTQAAIRAGTGTGAARGELAQPVRLGGQARSRPAGCRRSAR